MGTLKQVVGYVPNSTAGTRFATLNAGQDVFLNKVPSYASATLLTDPQLLILPVDSIVVRARVTNNGIPIVGGVTFDIGVQAFTVGAPTANNIFADVPLASVNAALIGSAATQDVLGTAGVAQSGIGPTVILNDKVSVLVKGGNNTAGDMADYLDTH